MKGIIGGKCIDCKFIMKAVDFLKTDLWRLFPVLNVDYVKAIPSDYPGAMGVPISFLDKWDPDQFEILDSLRPKIDGKDLYQRIIIRNLRPELSDEIDVVELLERYGRIFIFGRAQEKNTVV